MGGLAVGRSGGRSVGRSIECMNLFYCGCLFMAAHLFIVAKPKWLEKEPLSGPYRHTADKRPKSEWVEWPRATSRRRLLLNGRNNTNQKTQNSKPENQNIQTRKPKTESACLNTFWANSAFKASYSNFGTQLNEI